MAPRQVFHDLSFRGRRAQRVGRPGYSDRVLSSRRPSRAQAVNLFAWLGGMGVTKSQIRIEVWKLGARNQGEALQAAQAELKAGGLTSERIQLLRACVRELSAG